MDDTDFAALLCARLCHDLIGPVSAAKNGLAMAREDESPALRDDAMTLTADSLAEAVDRLRMFRLAFGPAGDGTTLAEARKAAGAIFSRGRVRLDWPEAPAPGHDEPGPDRVRLIVLMLLVAAEAAARGGTLVVEEAGRETLRVRATGPKVSLSDDLHNALQSGPNPNTTARTAPAALAQTLARRLGGTLAYVPTDEGAHLTYTGS